VKSAESGADPRTGQDDDQSRLSTLLEFLHEEAVGGALLLIVTAAALIWANSGAAESYVHFWHRQLTLGRHEFAVTEDLQGWVNDGAMAVFFFVVGLEIKRELVVGELRRLRAAITPAVAAIGGVALPALIYLLIAPAGEARHGWGIPMATDIAFAVGVLALLGRRASQGAKLFLLSIAIVDDLIAIAVIAIFYSDVIHWAWVGLALLGLAVIVGLRWVTANPWAYVLPAVLVWVAILESGIHATVAGVLLGLLTPARSIRGRSVLPRLEHLLHPVSVAVIVPLFALANAGIYLRGGTLSHAVGERLTWAVAVGLVAGKALGIAGATFLMLRLGGGTLPMGMSRREIWPIAALGGIGFTVALFISSLAFGEGELVVDAKIGIFIGSLAAAALAAILLRLSSKHPDPRNLDAGRQ
jgi:Na+:H+ antiporter, NhaA family